MRLVSARSLGVAFESRTALSHIVMLLFVEALAGKGSFDPEKTRVMHFTETPLVEALKEEVKVLQRQLEVAKGPKSSSKSAHHNPDKLNQRLKENFKEQIALFREGVYLATGFKGKMCIRFFVSI